MKKTQTVLCYRMHTLRQCTKFLTAFKLFTAYKESVCSLAPYILKMEIFFILVCDPLALSHKANSRKEVGVITEQSVTRKRPDYNRTILDQSYMFSSFSYSISMRDSTG